MKKYDSLFIIFAFFAIALAYTATDIYLPALPSIQTYFHISINLTQLTVTFYLLGWGIAQVIAGPISDHFGYRKIMLPCVITFAIVTLVCTFASNITLLIIGRAFQAVSGGMIGVTARASFIKRFDKERATYILMTLSPSILLSWIIAPLVGGTIVHYSNWRMVFLFLAIYSLIILVGMYLCFFVQETSSQYKRLNLTQMVSGYLEVLKHRQFMGYLLINGMCIGIFFTFFTESPFIYNAGGYTSREIGLTFIPIAVAFLISSQINRFLHKRFTMEHYIILVSVFLFFGLICMALPALFPIGLLPITIGISLCAFGLGFSSPVSFSKAATVLPHRAGYTSSVLTALPFGICTFLTIIVHPLCGNNIGLLALMLAFIALCSIIGYYFLQRTSDKQYPSHTKMNEIV